MSTEVRDNPEESRYELLVDGRLAGFPSIASRASESRFTTPRLSPSTKGGDSVTSWHGARWTTSEVEALSSCHCARSSLPTFAAARTITSTWWRPA
jgi:hypothetical protein